MNVNSIDTIPERAEESIAKVEVEKATNDAITDFNVEQMKKWKQLYDEGIVTKEEFDNKRKEILGI